MSTKKGSPKKTCDARENNMRRAEERVWKRRAEEDDIEEERLERDEPDNVGGDMMVEAVYGTGRAEWAWDDVRGGELDREEVRKARFEDVGYMKSRGL